MISHKDIYGWFDSNAEKFYASAIDRYPDGSHFVEIGTYMGMSTCFMAQEIKRRNKKIRFDAIDTFKGSVEHQVALRGKDLYKIFMENMKKAEVLDVVHAIAMDATEAANLLYDNNSLDFVFIDAAHDYDSVKNDIKIWMPKIKSGGILSGDDYVHVHPGVIQAVDEELKNNEQYKAGFRVFGRNWIYEKA